jgi:hypothetical protein
LPEVWCHLGKLAKFKHVGRPAVALFVTYSNLFSISAFTCFGNATTYSKGNLRTP